MSHLSKKYYRPDSITVSSYIRRLGQSEAEPPFHFNTPTALVIRSSRIRKVPPAVASFGVSKMNGDA
jgi:hypothetical protein